MTDGLSEAYDMKKWDVFCENNDLLFENDQLKADNAKLRELVRHMHICLEHYEPGDTISCEQCPYDNETWGCDYERLMAELGIEVDA